MDKLNEYFIILLSAGVGARMGKIGKIKPKSLLKVGKFSILKNIFFILKSRGASEVNLVVGYKYKKVLNEAKSFKGLKIRYIVVEDYINNGSVYSLYKSKNLWKNNKKKLILMMHSDLIFDPRYLDEIIKSKKKDIIGLRKEKKKKLKKNSFVANVYKDMRIKNIGKMHEVKNPYGEILCINKFSSKTFMKLMNFLKIYFENKTSNITWEYPLSDFLKKNKIFSLKDQNYRWININKPSDLSLAKKII